MAPTHPEIHTVSTVAKNIARRHHVATRDLVPLLRNGVAQIAVGEA
jgi:hypothetical protein